MEQRMIPHAMKRVLVTGGGTGIGLSVVTELIERSIQVCVVGRRPGPLAKAAALGADVMAHDIRTDPQSIFDAFGNVDGLVLNAGIQNRQDLGDWTAEVWREILETNLIAAAMLTQAFCEQSKGWGSIVGISSTLARVPAPATAAYAASKAGMMAMLRSVALEGAKRGIRANVILPGLVNTEMIQDGSDVAAVDNPDWIRLHPLGRIGQPGEIATVVADILGHDWMTGAEIAVDGGLMLGTAEK